MRNASRGQSAVETPLPGVSMPEVIEACAKASGWKKTEKAGPESRSGPTIPETLSTAGYRVRLWFQERGLLLRRGGTVHATIELHGNAQIERAVVYHAGADVGQGAHTAFAQMAADALNIPLEKIQMVVSDTATTGPSGSASASRMTFMAGNAIRGAAQEALKKWYEDEERPARATYVYRAPKTTPYDPQTGKSEPNFAYGYVAESAEVEVDIETGEVRLVRVICADDVGRAVNPQQVQGQVEGAVVQAAGYALMENFVQVKGQPLTRGLSTYLIPTVLDIPDQVESLILEYPIRSGRTEHGAWEMPYIPWLRQSSRR